MVAMGKRWPSRSDQFLVYPDPDVEKDQFFTFLNTQGYRIFCDESQCEAVLYDIC